jgi:hypothetical protein
MKIVEKNFKNMRFYYIEDYDIAAELFFNSKSQNWEVKTDDLNAADFNLIKMVKNDEVVGQLLDFLPKNHIFHIKFQIPELHEEDIYPHLDREESKVIIHEEVDENRNLVKEYSFNISDFKTEIYDIEDYAHYLSILDNLDSISSGYIGIQARGSFEGRIISVDEFSKSYNLLSEFFDTKSDAILYEIMKRQELTIFKEIYPQYKEQCEKVLNNIFKKVFEFIVDQNNKFKVCNIENFVDLPHSIKVWDIKNKEVKLESKLSYSLIAWRNFIELDIDYADIEQTYKII